MLHNEFYHKMFRFYCLPTQTHSQSNSVSALETCKILAIYELSVFVIIRKLNIYYTSSLAFGYKLLLDLNGNRKLIEKNRYAKG